MKVMSKNDMNNANGGQYYCNICCIKNGGLIRGTYSFRFEFMVKAHCNKNHGISTCYSEI